jgi:hypothetical protein
MMTTLTSFRIQGASFVSVSDCTSTGQLLVLLVEDPGELERGVFGPQRETNEDKMESPE